jgi:hypothetical protein
VSEDQRPDLQDLLDPGPQVGPTREDVAAAVAGAGHPDHPDYLERVLAGLRRHYTAEKIVAVFEGMRRPGDGAVPGPVQWRLIGSPAAVGAAVDQLGLEASGGPQPSRKASGRVLLYGTLRPGALPGEPDAQLPPLEVLLAAVHHSLTTGSRMTGANLALELLCARLGVDRDALVFRPGWLAERAGAGGEDAAPVGLSGEGRSGGSGL